MKKRKIIILSIHFVGVLALALFFFLFVINRDNHDTEGRFIINTTHYCIYDITPEDSVVAKYEYMIKSGTTIMRQETDLVHEPSITELDNGILRLEIGDGSNYNRIQYFDVYNVRASEVYTVPSIFVDFVTDSNQLLAFFDYSKNHEPILKVMDIFTNSEIADINRAFVSPVTGADALIFLIENEIYIDYPTGGTISNSENEREIICFREVEVPIVINKQ